MADPFKAELNSLRDDYDTSKALSNTAMKRYAPQSYASHFQPYFFKVPEAPALPCSELLRFDHADASDTPIARIQSRAVKTASLRVFWCSTKDCCDNERDRLMQKYLPELKARCEAVGICFTFLDLRAAYMVECADEVDCHEIYLREVTRSHVFLGVFARHYGDYDQQIQGSERCQWCAANVQRASTYFPMVARHPHASIQDIACRYACTELAGQVMCRFFFRHETYDIQREHACEQSNLPLQAKLFRSESKEASAKLDEVRKCSRARRRGRGRGSGGV